MAGPGGTLPILRAFARPGCQLGLQGREEAHRRWTAHRARGVATAARGLQAHSWLPHKTVAKWRLESKTCQGVWKGAARQETPEGVGTGPGGHAPSCPGHSQVPGRAEACEAVLDPGGERPAEMLEPERQIGGTRPQVHGPFLLQGLADLKVRICKAPEESRRPLTQPFGEGR